MGSNHLRNYKKFLLVIIPSLTFVFAMGYWSGRVNILGTIREFSRTAFNKMMYDIPNGPPTDLSKARTFLELEDVLKRRLEATRRGASEWMKILQTKDAVKQKKIVKQLRQKYLEILEPWPGPRVSLDPVSQQWFSKGAIDVSLVRFTTHPDITLLSAMLKPKNMKGPLPTLLVLHGSKGNLNSVIEDIDYHHGFGMKLAEQGFVVLAPLRVNASDKTMSRFSSQFLATGWLLEAIELWQLVRSIDYLETLDFVDPNHIGVYGISWGGQHAIRLSAIDERVSLTICSGYFTDRFYWKFNNPLNAGSLYRAVSHIGILPDMGFLFDDINLVALIQPRFFAVESGTKDPRHGSALSEFGKVDKMYNHIGYPDRTAFIPFSGGHETSIHHVLPFLNKWIHNVP
jgi:hypothetical protein